MMIETNQLRKIKDEAGGAIIEEFLGLMPKVYLFLVDDRIEHKKALTKTGVNKNIVATPNHNEYKDVLQNIQCLGPKYR